MKITAFAIERPVATSMLFLGLVIFGLMAYSKLAVNMMPDLKLPVLVVNTVHLGATPEEIEVEITDRIEKEVATISGLKKLQSYSMPSNSMIIVEFNMSKDADKALDEVKARLDLAIPFLPKEAERPFVQVYNPSEIPAISLIVSGDIEASVLYDYTDRVIKDKLARINGTSKIDLAGGEIREIQVLADKCAIFDVQMNLSEMAQYIRVANTKLSGGSFVHQHRKFAIESGTKFNSATEIGELYIPTPTGTRKLSDVTTVLDTVANVQYRALFFDVAANRRYSNIVSIDVMKSSGANAVKVAREVKEMLPELRQALPDGIDISLPFDYSDYVESAVDDALMNVGLGIALTGLILFFFLQDYRTTIIVSISVPVSLIGTFLAMRLFDGSLNMMTLMSFSVAIGALISNSIVVIENILRLRSEGMDIKQAAVEGTREVMMAVIASTGTNLVVFLPIATMTSITGAFFKEYALTISAATIFSLIVSFMLTPMLTTVLIRKEAKPSGLSRRMKRFFERLENVYEKSLVKLIAKRRRLFILFAGMFALFALSSGLLAYIGFEFEPQEDNGDVFVGLEMPEGTALVRSFELLQAVEERISRHKEVKAILSLLGEKHEFAQGSNFARITVKLYPKESRELSNLEVAEIIKRELDSIPEIIPAVSTVGSESGAPLEFTLQSSNQQDLISANSLVVEKLNSVEGLLNFESNYRIGSPVINLEPNQRLLAELNLSSFEIASAVRSAVNGVKAAVLNEKGKGYDIIVSYPADQINSVAKIERLPVFTPTGAYTVGQLVKVNYKRSQTQIVHIDKIKTVVFSASPAPGTVLSDARSQIQAAIDRLDLPQSVSFKWAGNIQELDDTIDDMLITFAIALLLMYMLLASLLENFWHPVIIFTTVPMAMIGVYVIMFAGGHTMNIMSLIAIVTLLGLVVNDDILIHDYSEQLMRRRNMNIREATILAGRRKMKTVIMTTVAIIAGMLPNALGIGDAGSEYRIPMAIVTIGGMITSTVLTLYLIPSLFYVARSKKQIENK